MFTSKYFWVSYISSYFIKVWEVEAADLTISPVYRAAEGKVDPNKVLEKSELMIQVSIYFGILPAKLFS